MLYRTEVYSDVSLVCRSQCVRISIILGKVLALSFCPLFIPMTLTLLQLFTEEETFVVCASLLFHIDIAFSLFFQSIV